MMLRQIVFSVLTVLVLLITGCGSPYVNIPPARGDLATHDPNGKGVCDVTVAAMLAVVDQTPLTGHFQVVLPEGTTDLTYSMVLGRISDMAVASGGGEQVEIVATFEINGIRIRGADAEVDILRPSTGIAPELITVYLTWAPGSDWSVDRLRTWRGNIDRTL